MRWARSVVSMAEEKQLQNSICKTAKSPRGRTGRKCGGYIEMDPK